MKKNIVFLAASAVVLIVAAFLLFGKSEKSADFNPVPPAVESTADTGFTDSESEHGSLAKATFDIVRVIEGQTAVAGETVLADINVTGESAQGEIF